VVAQVPNRVASDVIIRMRVRMDAEVQADGSKTLDRRGERWSEQSMEHICE